MIMKYSSLSAGRLLLDFYESSSSTTYKGERVPKSPLPHSGEALRPKLELDIIFGLSVSGWRWSE